LATAFAPIYYRLAMAEDVSPMVITFVRLALSALLLTPLSLYQGRAEWQALPKRTWGLGLLAGALLTCHFILLFSAVGATSVLIATVFINTSTVWVGVLEMGLLKEKFGPNLWWGMGLVMLGGLLIALSKTLAADGRLDFGGEDLLGAGFALLSAWLAAGYVVIGRKLRGGQMSTLVYISLVYSCGAVVAGLALLINGDTLLGYSREAYFWLAIITLLPQILGHSSMNYALSRLPGTLILIIGQVSTPIAALGAFVVLSELPTPLQILGSAVILGGILLSIHRGPARRPAFLSGRYSLSEVGERSK
jgi:drug/metabolite transporter (DMT)-like permease